jgi:hypothetical protein
MNTEKNKIVDGTGQSSQSFSERHENKKLAEEDLKNTSSQIQASVDDLNSLAAEEISGSSTNKEFKSAAYSDTDEDENEGVGNGNLGDNSQEVR